eukprot:6142986-Prymnesium_polylepis.1
MATSSSQVSALVAKQGRPPARRPHASAASLSRRAPRPRCRSRVQALTASRPSRADRSARCLMSRCRAE